jgi:hypothetical protein
VMSKPILTMTPMNFVSASIPPPAPTRSRLLV